MIKTGKVVQKKKWVIGYCNKKGGMGWGSGLRNQILAQNQVWFRSNALLDFALRVLLFVGRLGFVSGEILAGTEIPGSSGERGWGVGVCGVCVGGGGGGNTQPYNLTTRVILHHDGQLGEPS